MLGYFLSRRARQATRGARTESDGAGNPIGAPRCGSGILGHGPGPCKSPVGAKTNQAKRQTRTIIELGPQKKRLNRLTSASRTGFGCRLDLATSGGHDERKHNRKDAHEGGVDEKDGVARSER